MLSLRYLVHFRKASCSTALSCSEARATGHWLRFRVHDGFDVDGRRMQFGDLLDDSTFHQAASLAARGVISD